MFRYEIPFPIHITFESVSKNQMHKKAWHLLLMPLEPGDGPILNKAIHDSWNVLSKTLPWAKTLPSIEESEQFVLVESYHDWINKKALHLKIVDNDTNQMLGFVGLNHIDYAHDRANIGYWIRTGFEGHGIITNAVRGLMLYAREMLHFKHLFIRVKTDNQQSIAVAKRLGATPITPENPDFYYFELPNMVQLSNIRIWW